MSIIPDHDKCVLTPGHHIPVVCHASPLCLIQTHVIAASSANALTVAQSTRGGMRLLCINLSCILRFSCYADTQSMLLWLSLDTNAYDLVCNPALNSDLHLSWHFLAFVNCIKLVCSDWCWRGQLCTTDTVNCTLVCLWLRSTSTLCVWLRHKGPWQRI